MALPRPSHLQFPPSSNPQTTSTSTSSRPRPSVFPTTTSASSNRARQYAHLHAQLAQLEARLADTSNIVDMTCSSATAVRGLGGYVAGLFMAGSKVLEEGPERKEEDGKLGEGEGGEKEEGEKEEDV